MLAIKCHSITIQFVWFAGIDLLSVQHLLQQTIQVVSLTVSMQVRCIGQYVLGQIVNYLITFYRLPLPLNDLKNTGEKFKNRG